VRAPSTWSSPPSLFASGGADKLEQRFDLDDLITNFTIYWVTETIGSAMRSYLENARALYGNPGAPRPARSNVPAAFARMPLDAPVPREWVQRNVNMVQFTEFPRGGHFSSWETPREFAEDMRAFAAKLA
jgi:pimeloyl-ACP methyl ester carboxylesterase